MRNRFIAIVSLILAGCAAPDDRSALPAAAASTAKELARAAAYHSITPRSVTYRTIGGRPLAAHIFSPEETSQNGAAILLFHGGGYFTGDPRSTFPEARAFASAGYTAIAIQYRLADDENTPLEALSDACHALRWVRDSDDLQRVDGNKVALYGVSAGSHLAANLVTHGCGEPVAPPIALLLNSSSIEVMSFADRFEQLTHGRAKAEDHSPLHNMTAAVPPVAIAQGVEDRLAPIAFPERFCQRQIGFGGRCELLRFPDRGHLMSRNLEQQTPGAGFDPDLDDLAESYAFFIAFLDQEL